MTLIAFVFGAGLLALWVDVRFPKLAPSSLPRRLGAACGAFVLLQVTPVLGGSAAGIYATLFAILLPAFVITFLTGVWLLRALLDLRAA
jgi:hypothetical protein